MRKLFSEQGLSCHILPPVRGTREDAQALLEAVLDIHSARLAAGRPSFRPEVFLPGSETSFRESQPSGPSLSILLPKTPVETDLLVLLIAALALPEPGEMADPAVWDGGPYRLTGDLFRDCLFSGAEVSGSLAFWESVRLTLTAGGRNHDCAVFSRAAAEGKGRVRLDADPLALALLLGESAQAMLSPLEQLLARRTVGPSGLAALAFALADVLAPEEDGEVTDEFSLEELFFLLTGREPDAESPLAQTLPALLKTLGTLPGWSVRSFTEIADEDGKGLTSAPGTRIWRVTRME